MRNGRKAAHCSFSDDNTMTCKFCVKYYRKHDCQSNSFQSNTFIKGWSNRRVSIVIDHEKSRVYFVASPYDTASEESEKQTPTYADGRALSSLKQSERHRISNLFRNANAIIKNNRPFIDYVWL